MKEKVGKCVLCGLCDGADEAYPRDARRASRHAVWLLRKGKPGPVLYAAMLNGRADAACPLAIGICEAIIEGRQRLVKSGVETKANRAFMARLAKGENPHK